MRKSSGGAGTLYWFGKGGKVLEETDLSGNFQHDYVYALGKLLGRQDAPPSSSPVYTEFLTDPLGSIRYVEGPNGTEAESDYYPFGGERVISNSSVDEPCGTLTTPNHYKFTGLERDTETGLDHTLFRQLSSNYGRWLSPDPRGGDPTNPQSFNRYAYVMNNPVTLTDRRGLDPEDAAAYLRGRPRRPERPPAARRPPHQAAGRNPVAETDFSRTLTKEAERILRRVYLPRILKCLQQLSPEQIWWRPNPASNSAGNLVLHLTGNVRQWIVAGLGGAPDMRRRHQEFAERGPLPRRALVHNLRRTVEDACRTLRLLDAQRLGRTYSIQGYRVTGFEACFHVAEHFSHHAGQIILITKLLTGRKLGFTRLPATAPKKA